MDPLGRYEIVQELGRGAMGIVYKARDPLIDRMVAVKSVDLDASVEQAEAIESRFFREAKSAGRLNHVNIVTIHDVGRSGDNAYIAMEFLEGRSLREIIDSGVVLPQEQIADIAAQIAEGLACAHDNGVIHRDIKPANLMLLYSGIVKITDFGIALLPRGSRTIGGVLGSPKYISPEQVVGKEADGRSDIFALGAVLYELLTGSPAFTASDLDSILSQVINDLPPPPSTRNRNIGVGFDHVVAKAMAKHPDDRYRSADEMASDLRNYRNLGTPAKLKDSQRTLERRARRRAASENAQPAPEALKAPASVASTTTASGSTNVAVSRKRDLILLGALAALLAGAAVWTMGLKRPPKPAETSVQAAPLIPPPVSVAKADDSPRTEASPPETPKEAAPAPAPAPSPTASMAPITPIAKPPASPARSGHLAFAVTPWGEVYVDGRRRGISPPLREIRLPPGKHVVEIRNTSFKRYSQSVDLVADANVRIKHKFQ